MSRKVYGLVSSRAERPAGVQVLGNAASLCALSGAREDAEARNDIVFGIVSTDPEDRCTYIGVYQCWDMQLVCVP